MKEYYIDLTDMPNSLLEFLVDSGAVLKDPETWATPIWKGKDMYLGRRKVHKFAGSSSGRIFFDESNLMVASAVILMYPNIVMRHNIIIEELV